MENNKMMNKRELKKLSKAKLINLVEMLQHQKPFMTPSLEVRKPTLLKRKSVSQMINDYEENIILPPLQFRDDYKPRKQIALPTTKIEKTKQALKDYTESYKLSIKNRKDPLIQLQNTRLAVGNHLKNILKSMKGFKYIETLEVTFEKMSNDDIINKTAYFNSDTETITNDNEITESLEYSKERILNIISI